MRDSGIWNRIREKAKRRLTGVHGFTMAEMLIVVAIIAVLGGVSFIAVNRYQRSMGQLERDAIAKQIFVAAQNHLSAAKGEGYLGKTTEESVAGMHEADDVYYVVVNHGKTLSGTDAFASVSTRGRAVEPVINDMLPFGSIDETIRTGGNYIIRYYREAGMVKDVFYCSANETPAQFNHTFFDGDSYGDVCARAGENNKAVRRTYVNNSILGWYGGTEVETLEYKELAPPEIEVINAERLYVRIKDPNLTNPGLTQGDLNMRLIVKGESSGKEHYLNINSLNWTGEKEADGSLIVVLDDITNQTQHFCNRKFDDMQAGTENGFIPGENITVQAMVDGKVGPGSKVVYVPAYSARETTNSLFASIADPDGDKLLDTAYIANIRHLENLDKAVSNLDANDPAENKKISLSSAVQTVNLDWRTWRWASSPVTAAKGSLANDYSSQYYPVSPDYRLSYDGNKHSISNVTASTANAGLFGTISANGSEVKNLALLDFTVTGTSSAGALAGSASNTTVTNVLARNDSKTGATVDITATSGSAGGLIGSVTGNSSVSLSAAALSVNGSANAGGLVGTASGSISQCYSGGHTKNGNYKDWVTANHYDVVGATAGGLVGSFAGSAITESYSTCSVSGAMVGGFAGTAGGSITNCYCTGLVTGTTEGAFAASLSGTASGCRYYEIVNERTDAQTGFAYLKAVGNRDQAGVSCFDSDLTSYNSFIGGDTTWEPAHAYDVNLRLYYKNLFPLRTVFQLEQDAKNKFPTRTEFVRTHYGDWPAPETFVINK